MVEVKEVHCDKCPEVFTNNEDLQAHISTHKLKADLYQDRGLEHMLNPKVLLKRIQIYQCGKCPRCFLHYVPLNEHQREHSKKRKKILHEDKSELKPHKCEECNLRFVQLSTLTAHLKVHEPFPHICHCSIGFYQAEDLATHKRLVHPTLHPKKEFPEPELSEFAVKPKKKRVKLEKKEPKPQVKYVVAKRKNTQIKNDRCSSNKENCKLAKNNDGDYECSFCELIFTDKTKFFAHVNSHTGKWAHVCDKCPYGSKTEAMMIVHRKRHQEGYNGTMNCDVCKKNYKSRESLTIHMLIHTGEKQFKCTLCPKSFTQPCTLKSHIRRHEGIYAYECDHCQKRFVDKGSLALHCRIHSGVKPYSCNYCGKAFSDPSAFQRHKRIHTGLKPYRCRFCPKAFSDNSAWIAHMRRHEGYTSMYPCKICNKQLATHANLQIHLRTHINDKTYVCDYCGNVYYNKHYLGGHIRRVHLRAKIYNCRYCKNPYQSQQSLNKHVKRAHETWNKDLCCQVCDLMFDTEDLLKNHIEQNLCKVAVKDEYDARSAQDSVMSDLNHRSETCCKTCFKNLSSFSALSQHKCVTCCICNRYFKSEVVMKKHFMQHFKRQLVCPYCRKKFHEASALQKHRSETHSMVTCDHCGEEFKGKKVLRTHIWTKHMLSVYCNVCLKRFYTETEFIYHKRGCMIKKTCKFCKLKVKIVSMAAHMARHANETFKCDRCEMTYQLKKDLFSHMKWFHRVGK